MSRVRFDFLNWRPDADDFANDGLTVADNVVHDSEGWKQVPLETAGAFVTTGGLTTVTALVAKPIGSRDDLLCCWLSDSQNIHVGVNGVTGTSPTTGYPISFSTAVSGGVVTAFDVCEVDEQAVFVARVEGNKSIPATSTAISFAGYIAI